MENNIKPLAEFIKENHLNDFSTYDFDSKLKAVFGCDNVWCIDDDSSDRHCQKVIVRYNDKITTLEFIHSMFTFDNSFSQHHYILTTEL